MRRELVDVQRAIEPFVPGFRRRGKLLFQVSFETVLRGLIFETSGFDKDSLMVSVFVLPLCVPAEHVYLNFGSRLRNRGGGDRWLINDGRLLTELGRAVESQAIPFLNKNESLDSFVETAKDFSLENPTTLRAIAYALIRLGKVSDGVEYLERLHVALQPDVPWQATIRGEAEMLVDLTFRDPPAATRKTEEWERLTRKNLKLE